MNNLHTHMEEWQMDTYLIYLMTRTGEENEQDTQEIVDEEEDDIRFAAQWEAHIAQCDHCAQIMHDRYTKATVFQNWSVVQDNRAFLQVQVHKALQTAAESALDLSLRQRLLMWKELSGGLSRSAMKLFLHAKQIGKRAVSQISMEGIQTLVRPETHWDFQYATAGLQGRSTDQPRQIHDLTRVNLVGEHEGIDVSISIDNQINGFRIRMTGASEDKIPIFLLFRKNHPDAPILCTLTHDPEEQAWVSEIPNLAQGEYLLALEPEKESVDPNTQGQ